MRHPPASTIVLQSLVTLFATLIGSAAFADLPTTLSRDNVEDVKKETVLLKHSKGTGSGFFVSDDGLIATNWHVVVSNGKQAKDTRALTAVVNPGQSSEKSFPATIVCGDSNQDLAIVKIDYRSKKIPLGSTKELYETQGTWVFGFPLGTQLRGSGAANPSVSVSRGSITALRRDSEQELESIQTDAAVSPGNSGGPVVNSAGELIGVVRAKVVREDVEGINMAIPIEKLRNLLVAKKDEIAKASSGTDRPVANDEPQTFFMVVDADPDQTTDTIQTTLRQGLTASKFKCDSVRVTAISGEVYNRMSALITGGVAGEIVQGGDISVLPYVHGASQWVLGLGGPHRELVKLVVKFKGDSNKDQTYQPGLTESPLRFHSPGRYILTLKDGKVPQSYTGTAYDDTTEKEYDIKGEWPVTRIYFVVHFRNFVGNREALFKTLQNAKLVPTPVKGVQKSEPISMVLASINPFGGKIQDGFSHGTNIFVARIPKPHGREPKRVWMLFPLSKKQVEQRWKELHGSTRDNEKFSKLIRKEEPVPADEASVLTPNMQARWFELPRFTPEGGKEYHFERAFTFTDIKQWKAIKDLAAYRLVVWEFDSGLIVAAVEVIHPRKNKRTFVIDQEIEAWPIGISRLDENAKK